MYRTITTTFIISLMTAFLVSVLFYKYSAQPKIVTVDIARITTVFIREEVSRNRSRVEREQAIRKFSEDLENSLAMLSKKDALILMPKEAVIKGSPDYTDSLMKMIGMEQKP